MLARSAQFLAAVLRRGSPVRATVRGTSMWPTLSPGDRVRVDPVPPGWRPRPGDVVAATGPSGIVVHRVISASDGRVVTWGDNAAMADEPIGTEKIVGRVDPSRSRTRWFQWGR